jgi:hypothetical protein
MGMKGRELRTLVAAPGRGRPQEHHSRARVGALSEGLEANIFPDFDETVAKARLI